MTFISTTPPEAARDAVADMYRRQQDSWGFVPNYAKVFSHRPEVLARWGQLLAEIKRSMDRRRFELVTFAAAHQLGNSACALAHGKVLREFFDDYQIISIAARRTLDFLSEAEKALLDFARRVAADASQITADDVRSLRRVGFADDEIFDIAAAAAGRGFFTKLLDALGVKPDAPFAELGEPLRSALTVGRPIDVDAPARMPVSTPVEVIVAGGAR
jgi:uncharacterized peroxidase-related enzyme